MLYKKFMVVIALAALTISSCQMPAPQTETTPVPTKPFVKPLPTDPMGAVGTSLASAAQTSGVPTATPNIGGIAPSSTPNIGGLILTSTPTVGLPGGNTLPSSTPTTGKVVPSATVGVVIGRPASYTLHEGEFPYCIARRYNVDPTELLALSGLSDGVVYPAGTVLRIPQSGSFPGDRALRQHPTTYTVTSSNETFYSIACLFGDVDPAQIAQVNGIALGTPLTMGQAIKIP